MKWSDAEKIICVVATEEKKKNAQIQTININILEFSAVVKVRGQFSFDFKYTSFW